MATPNVTPGVAQAPAGKYQLKAIWNEIVSEFGAPKQFVKHLPGDIVHLETDVAERFLRHGLADPLAKDALASEAATAPTPADKAGALNAQVGAQPVLDTEVQQPIKDTVVPAVIPPKG